MIKKLGLILGCLLLVTGCGTDKKLEKSYDKMQIGSIDSYQLDLRIYGSYKEKSYSEIVKVDNYKDKEFKIDYISNYKKDQQDETDKALYIIDGMTYRFKKDKYEKSTETSSLYNNPNVYLKGLENIKNTKSKEEKIGSNKYYVYEVTISKDVMNEILNDSVLSDVELTKDVPTSVWLDKDGYLYKIVYQLNKGFDSDKKLEINASYFRINKINEIKTTIGLQ